MRRAPTLIPLSALTSAVAGMLGRGRRARARRAGPWRLMHVVLNLRVGGLERMVLDLVRSTDRSRFEVQVCCLDGGGDLQHEFDAAGVPVTLLGMSEAGGGAVLERLIARMREGEIDVVNTHNVLPFKFGAIAATSAGVPVIVHTKHGRNFVRRPFEHPKSPVYSHLLSWVTDRIVAVSDDVREVSRRYEFVPGSKIVTIANGVDVRRFEAAEVDRPALLRALDLPEDARLVVNVARFVPEKDHATLVHAFARVLKAIPQAHLLLVGEGALMEPARRLCRELGVERHVRMAGQRRDIPQLLKVADVFALSSTTEGTSISLLEAMAAEVPVVATAVGGNPELVSHLVSGRLCPARDPDALAAELVATLEDPARARALAAAAKQKVVAGYSLERTAAAYARLYEDLLGRKLRGPKGATDPA